MVQAVLSNICDGVTDYKWEETEDEWGWNKKQDKVG